MNVVLGFIGTMLGLIIGFLSWFLSSSITGCMLLLVLFLAMTCYSGPFILEVANRVCNIFSKHKFLS